MTPTPIPIGWSLSDLAVAGSVAAAVGAPEAPPAFPPLPHQARITEALSHGRSYFTSAVVEVGVSVDSGAGPRKRRGGSPVGVGSRTATPVLASPACHPWC